jgi:hypothetical protein
MLGMSTNLPATLHWQCRAGDAGLRRLECAASSFSSVRHFDTLRHFFPQKPRDTRQKSVPAKVSHVSHVFSAPAPAPAWEAVAYPDDRLPGLGEYHAPLPHRSVVTTSRSRNFSQCVAGQRQGTWARGGLQEARLFPHDGLWHGEEMIRVSARFDARQTLRN